MVSDQVPHVTDSFVCTSNHLQDTNAYVGAVSSPTRWLTVSGGRLCPIIVWALQMIKKYTEVEVTILVAALRPRLREMFANSGVFSLLSEENFFVSVHDAVLVALAELHSTTTVAAAAEDGMGGAVALRRRLTIDEMIKKYTEVEVTILVAALRPRLREMFANSGVFSLLSEENFFVSVHDAVLVALAELHSTTTVAAAAEDGMGGAVALRRRLTIDEVRSILETDPDVTTDLSLLDQRSYDQRWTRVLSSPKPVSIQGETSGLELPKV
ncbi:hypothetical protein EGR_10567 [Echinococcus granulosus]|uniref:STAS domain-containing protein n=1 Tax=Echinococcus granulosus TaxID=6210 RepID=W6U231_ECHGR|nr:hypothetical protein EGR_10567 [Echinococcus granulosus]EUB54581.1 hypothetical protein EGR_10567 [Echinococcus granulosus]